MNEMPQNLEPLESLIHDFNILSTVDLHELKILDDKCLKQNKIVKDTTIKDNIRPKYQLEPCIADDIGPKKCIDVKQYNELRCQRSQINLSDIEKKKEIHLLMCQGMPQSNASSNMCIKIIFFGLVGVIAIILSSLLNEFNDNVFHFADANLELRKKVYGQDKALDQLNDHYKENIEKFDIVVMIGGSGVGKSYASEIIKKHFPYQHNIFEYSPPLKNFHELAYDKLSPLHCNLIILEYLKLNDLLEVVNFIEYLNNQTTHYCTYTLAIFNPEIIDNNLTKIVDLDSSVNDIRSAFSLKNISITTIIFNPLSIDIIDICIEVASSRSNIRLTEEQFLKVRQHLSLTNSGCKGAYAKVQLYGNQ